MSARTLVLALAIASTTGCATGPGVSRPLDEDLLALLPTHGELVLDVEPPQLRAWHLAKAVKELVYDRLPIPGPLKAPLWEADALALSVRGLVDWTQAEVIVIVKGPPPIPAPPPDARGLRTRAKLGAIEVVRLGARLWATGPAEALDKLVDRVDRVDRSRLEGPGDALREILQLAPSGKYGRPAIRFAARLPGELRGRIAEVVPSIGATDDVALAFAVADGFDLGAVLRMRSSDDARAGTERLRRDLQGLLDRPLVSMLGLAPLLAPLKTGRRESDLHLAYRLPTRDAEALFERLRSLFRLTDGVLKRARDNEGKANGL